MIDTVGQGIVTGDLKGKTTTSDQENIVDIVGFLEAVERTFDALDG